MAEDRKGLIEQGLDLGKVDETELKTIIARELDMALGAEGSQLSDDRQKLLEYYEGLPFGNEIDGRSQVVMRSVLEVVEWVLPALLRIFTASDKLVQYEPTNENDEGAADQATDYGNYIINRDNEGFMLLHDWMKDCLIQKLGWVKIYWDTAKERTTNTFTGLTDAEYQAMLGPSVETISHTEYPAPQPGGFNEDSPDPQAAGAMLHDCKLRVTRTEGRVRIENVPPEEVLVSRRAKRGNTPFICHRRERTRTELLLDGYDADTLDMVPSYDRPEYNTERQARYAQEDDLPYGQERTDKPMRSIWVEESYLWVDIDGDGIAELCKAVTSGDGAVLLTKDGEPDFEEVDEVGLISLCPIPMPHKIMGMSVADLVTDLQLIKSTLMRQMLDNLYLTNNSRTIVEDSAANDDTFDDLLTSRPGGIVRVKQAAGIVPMLTPFVADKAMQIIEYIDETSEVRTGVSRRNQGLAPDDINKTALAANATMQAAAQRVELIARIFAETGIKNLARMVLGMVQKYQQRERVIRLTGKWVTMDPRQWKSSMQVSVSVGLGTGNRDQILSHLGTILQTQQNIIVGAAKGAPQFGALVTPKNVYDVVERLTENAGFKESFFTDPSQPPAPGQAGPSHAPPPDPEMMKAQHGMQIDQAKAQVDQQVQQQRLQADLQVQQQKAATESQMARERAAFEMQLEETKAKHAMQLELQREQAKNDLARYEIDARARAGAYTPGPAPAPAAPQVSA